MSVPSIKTSFVVGELAPALFGHVDLAKFSIAASTMRNCFVNYRGGAYSRAGTAFVGASLQNPAVGDAPPRLIRFQFNINQGYCLEFGNFYMRVISNGAFVLSGGVPFVLVTPYAATDLPLLKFTQSADVMSFTHPNYPPYDLARIAANNWTITAVTFGAQIGSPNAATAIATVHPNSGLSPPTLPCAYAYAITAVAINGEEGVSSPLASVTDTVDMSVTAGSEIVTWNSVVGANIYNIYRAPTSYNTDPGNPATALPVPTGALFGLVGQSYGTEFVDSNVLPDFTQVPPLHFNPFPGAGNYPGCVAYYQQRRVYAATINQPDTYWMSQPGKFLNFDSRIPSSDTDAITGTPWAQQVNGIQFMLPMPGGLVVLTGLGAWQIGGSGGSALNPQPITPSSQQAQPQAFNGCSMQVPPFAVNYDILYVQAKGSIVRDLAYNYWVNIYTGSDLTELSSQLFSGYTIQEWAWCEEPYKIAWMVRNDGTMLSLTYLKEQEVYGWARHDTFGAFESVCSVTEPPVDALYVVSVRYPGTGVAYYIERMDNRIWNSVEDPWCVDCGLAYPMVFPSVGLGASGTTGNVVFSASAPFFNSGHVGQVIRMGGGIATVTAFIDSEHVAGTLSTPINQVIPNYASGLVPNGAGSGQWSITQPTTTVSGLGHLTGMLVTGLADGIPIPPQVVSVGGTITLSTPASNIKVGLAFQPQVQTVYLDGGAQPTIQGRRKDITAVTVRVEASSSLKVGTNQPDGSVQQPPTIAPQWTNLQDVPDQGTTYVAPGGGTVTNLFTGDLRVNVAAGWAKPGQVAVQQDFPLPMNIVAIIPETLEGDVPEQTYADKGQKRDPREMPRGPGAWMLRA